MKQFVLQIPRSYYCFLSFSSKYSFEYFVFKHPVCAVHRGSEIEFCIHVEQWVNYSFYILIHLIVLFFNLRFRFLNKGHERLRTD
jgi:hypothetical protein